MPQLQRIKWEMYALGLSQGLEYLDAYVRAGFKPSRAAARNLQSKSCIKLRVAELRRGTAELVADRVVVNREWGLGRLRAVVEKEASGPPKVADQVAAIALTGRWLGWEEGKRPLGEQPLPELPQGGAVAAESHVLSRAEECAEFASSIVAAVEYYGVATIDELVARLRGQPPGQAGQAALTEGEEAGDA